MDDEFLTSGDVASFLSVATSTVKRWADTGQLCCAKTLGKHRRFKRCDVERFAAGAGLSLAPEALSTRDRVLDEAEVGEHVDLEAIRVAPEPVHGEAASSTVEIDTTRWLELLRGDSTALSVHAALVTERARLGSWTRVGDALGEVLRRIGDEWAAGRMEVLDEHLASERLRRGLAMCAELMPVAPGSSRCVLATAVGDDHTLGLALAELCLREHGWQPLVFGRATPLEELVRFVGTAMTSADMVALSASQASQDALALTEQARRMGEACRARGLRLVLGGAGAWPEALEYGRRVHRLAELGDELQRAWPPELCCP